MPTLTRSRILIGVGVATLLGILCVLLAAILVLGVDQANLTSQVDKLSSNMTSQVNDEASTLEPEIAGTVRGEVNTGRTFTGTFEPRTPGAGRKSP